MDIIILLGLQEFRNGTGSFLAEFLKKMTFLGELNTTLVLLAVYTAVKSYPADYDAEGKLIVDGAKMANDTFKSIGWAAAFLPGWPLERRFAGFSTEVPVAKKLARCAAGLVGFYAVSLVIVPAIKTWLPGPAGTIVSCYIQMLYITFLFPWCMKRFEKQDGEQA